MRDAYNHFIEEWNKYVRDLSNTALTGRPGMRQIVTDYLNIAHESFSKRVLEFAAAFVDQKK
jgi:hypothetical protein